MELLKGYSNQNIVLGKLQRLLELPQRREASVRPSRQQRLARRVPPDQVANLLTAYEAGQSTDEVAAAFGVHRTTVVNILNRHSVTLRVRGLADGDLPEVIRLYQQGWSLAWLAANFDVAGRRCERCSSAQAWRADRGEARSSPEQPLLE